MVEGKHILFTCKKCNNSIFIKWNRVSPCINCNTPFDNFQIQDAEYAIKKRKILTILEEGNCYHPILQKYS
jgi:hypothetical protein